MREKREKKRITWRYILMNILGGEILKRFVIKHSKIILLIFVLMFFYIGNRYTCIIKLREIDRLQMQLKEVKAEALAVSVQLTEYTRPSQVEELVRRLGLNLEKAKTPPYKLQKKK